MLLMTMDYVEGDRSNHCDLALGTDACMNKFDEVGGKPGRAA